MVFSRGATVERPMLQTDLAESHSQTIMREDMHGNTEGLCGPMQIRRILQTHGIRADVPDLYSSWLMRLSDTSTPWGIAHVLRANGIAARVSVWRKQGRRTSIHAQPLIAEAKRSLESGSVIIMLIRSRKLERLHWISLWGFDAAEGRFEAYDSKAGMQAGQRFNTLYSGYELLSRAPVPFGTFVIETTAGAYR